VDRFRNILNFNAGIGRAVQGAKRRRGRMRHRPGTELLETRTAPGQVLPSPPSAVQLPGRVEPPVVLAHPGPSSHITREASVSHDARGSRVTHVAAPAHHGRSHRSAPTVAIHDAVSQKIEIHGQYGVVLDVAKIRGLVALPSRSML
jgi:hypothetical protein